MNTSPGQAGFDVRWDVVPGSFGFSNYINSTDISKITIITNKLGSVCSQGTKPTISPSTINSDIYAGDNISFSWKANSANPPCDASGDWSGQKEVSGTYSPTKATQIKTYSFILKCYGTEGWTQASYSFNAKNPSPDKINNAKLYSTGSTVYVIQDNKKRWVESPAVMDKCRYDWGAIISGPAVDVYLPYVPTNSDSLGMGDSCAPVESAAMYQCLGNPHMDLSPTTVTSGKNITITASGMSDCASYDKISFAVAVNGNWQTKSSCTLNNTSSCTMSWTTDLGPGSYTTILFLDKDSNGTIEAKSDQQWVTIVLSTDPPYIKPIDCSLVVINGFYSSHMALDLQCSGGYSATIGQPVRTVSTGTVIFVGDLDGSFSCGIEVKVRTIASDGRKFVFRYCHLSGVATGINEGATVSQGLILGWLGNTGSTSGGLLHLCTELNGPETCYAASGYGQIDPRTIISF